MQHYFNAIVLGMILIAIGLVGTCMIPNRSHANNDCSTTSPIQPTDELVEALLRILWSERDEALDVNDDYAIIEVLRNRSCKTGTSLLTMARRYSPESTGAQETTRWRQRYISRLTIDGLEPLGWRQMNETRVREGKLRLPWDRRRQIVTTTVQRIRNTLRNPRPVCEISVDHWGGHMDDRNPMNGGWRHVDCGPTVNYIWCDPGERTGAELEQCLRQPEATYPLRRRFSPSRLARIEKRRSIPASVARGHHPPRARTNRSRE